jgi:predicted RND superfamily exporter protein
VVLSCGLAALTYSNLPTLRLFGWLSAFAMLAALVADLLILRPAITYLMRLSRKIRPYDLSGREGGASYLQPTDRGAE